MCIRDSLLSEATIRFFKANGITKLPTVKELTAEIEALMLSLIHIY